jgi:hypothetical protein
MNKSLITFLLKVGEKECLGNWWPIIFLFDVSFKILENAI